MFYKPILVMHIAFAFLSVSLSFITVSNVNAFLKSFIKKVYFASCIYRSPPLHIWVAKLNNVLDSVIFRIDLLNFQMHRSSSHHYQLLSVPPNMNCIVST